MIYPLNARCIVFGFTPASVAKSHTDASFEPGFKYPEIICALICSIICE